MDDDIATLKQQLDQARRVAVTLASDLQHTLMIVDLHNPGAAPEANERALALANEWTEDYEYGV